MSPAETRIVLVRHGQSGAQVDGILSGHDTCTGLSDLGREQAARLHDRLARTGELADTAALYSSILPRAVETATIIAPALGAGVAAAGEPVAECAFCEIHVGEAEGVRWDDIGERFPDFDGWADPTAVPFPGSESVVDLQARVADRLAQVAADHPGERVVVVAHGGVIGASFAALGGSSAKVANDAAYELVNTSLTEWRGSGDEWTLVRFNDAAHTL